LVVSGDDCFGPLDEIGVQILPALGLPHDEPEHLYRLAFEPFVLDDAGRGVKLR
jgi:hypothetical protein